MFFIGLLALGLQTAVASEALIIFNLNGITNPSYSSLQYQTNNQLVYNANLTDWSKSGFNSVHAIQISSNPLNWAIMIFGDNLITQQTAFAANDAGKTYYASYDIGPTVYANANQATQADDFLRVNLLNSLDQVIATTVVAPGAWNGVQTFSQAYFSYVGDGTGLVRLQMRSDNPASGRFSGAVDNFAFWDSEPTNSVPEPSTFLLLSVGISGILQTKWKKRQGRRLG